MSAQKTELHCDTAIIGGGLSGLAACLLLQQKGIDVHLFEAMDRLGGRIDSLREKGTGTPVADFGPTWVWPYYQPTIASWLKKLEVKTFQQFESGLAVIERGQGRQPEQLPIPGQHGMVRIDGGPQSLINRLVGKIRPEFLHAGTAVSQITVKEDGYDLFTASQSGIRAKCRLLILALPPRIAAQQFGSDLFDPATLSLLQQTPTWMATQAKTAITYARPFWRDAGLSGRVASETGPLVEIHDHCSADGKTAALFGFVGWSPRRRSTGELEQAIREQLLRCFGPQGTNFLRLETHDWAKQAPICSIRDLQTPPHHPQPMPEAIRSGFHGGRMFLAGAETATHSPGLIDGALEAAERVAAQVAANRLSSS